MGAAALAVPVPATAAIHGCGSPGIPALSVVDGSHVNGSVLIAAAGRRVTVAAARRSPLSARGVAWLEFCLRPLAVPRAVTLVQVAPRHISVSVTRAGKLVLTVRGASASAAIGADGRADLVEIVLDRRRARASLLINGRRRTSVPASIPTTVQVRVGGSAPPARAGSSSTPALSATSGTPTAFAASTPTGSTTRATTTAATPPSRWTTPAPATAVVPITAASLAGITAGQASAASVWPASNPFSPTSFWNAPLATDAAIDPNSAAYVNDLVSQVKQYGAWMNTTWYSVPTYVVPPNQPTVKVTLDTWGPDLQSAWNAVPIPTGATAANGSDESMSVWQPSTDKMWDFWLAHQTNGQWHARWGGEMDHVSTSPGYFTHSGQTNNWGGTATGLAWPAD